VQDAARPSKPQTPSRIITNPPTVPPAHVQSDHTNAFGSRRNDYDSGEDVKQSDELSDSSHSDTETETETQQENTLKKTQSSAVRHGRVQQRAQYAPVSAPQKVNYQSPPTIGMRVRHARNDRRHSDYAHEQPYVDASNAPRDRGERNIREWRSPFCCSCCYLERRTCLYVCCCPCCAQFDNAIKIGLIAHGTDRFFWFGKWCLIVLLIFLMCCGMAPWFALLVWTIAFLYASVSLRQAIRKYYCIQDDCACDLLAYICRCTGIPICAVGQETAECQEEYLL